MTESEKKARRAGRKAKRAAAQQKQKQKQPQTKPQGHYADPMSPIASTPMKRQRTKSTGASRGEWRREGEEGRGGAVC
jgi:hypothetical protein